MLHRNIPEGNFVRIKISIIETYYTSQIILTIDKSIVVGVVLLRWVLIHRGIKDFYPDIIYQFYSDSLIKIKADVNWFDSLPKNYDTKILTNKVEIDKCYNYLVISKTSTSNLSEMPVQTYPLAKIGLFGTRFNLFYNISFQYF